MPKIARIFSRSSSRVSRSGLEEASRVAFSAVDRGAPGASRDSFPSSVMRKVGSGLDATSLTLARFVAGLSSLALSCGVRPFASALAKLSSIFTPFGSNRKSW